MEHLKYCAGDECFYPIKVPGFFERVLKSKIFRNRRRHIIIIRFNTRTKFF